MEISKLVWTTAFAHSVRTTSSVELIAGGYTDDIVGRAAKATNDAALAVEAYEIADQNLKSVPLFVSERQVDT